MKKSERINDMIRFLNDKQYFNLNDLINKYNISKSTALRDISSLEELGMPIFSESGRYGRYGLLKNKLLSPIIFTMDEVYALYFAMLTLECYQSTPFHLSFTKLNEKFEACLSRDQLNQIARMKKLLQFEVYPHSNVSYFLDKILESILNEQSCNIKYVKNNKEINYHVQFFKISAKFGQWYVTGIEINTNKYKVFRCDKIISLQFNDITSELSTDELLNKSLELYKSKTSIEFEVEILEKGKDIFYKEPYPSMKLEDGDKLLIKGFYNLSEEDFIANYFIRYSNYVISVKPESLKNAIKSKINNLLSHYKKL